MRDLDSVVTPGLTHWQHPGFYAYFPANTSGPSVLGDLVCAGVGVQGMLWATGPACTEMETVMLDWLADAARPPGQVPLVLRGRRRHPGLGLLGDAGGDAGGAAPGQRGRWRTDGVDRRYTIYTSTQGHSSIEKAARIAGVGDSGRATDRSGQ